MYFVKGEGADQMGVKGKLSRVLKKQMGVMIRRRIGGEKEETVSIEVVEDSHAGLLLTTLPVFSVVRLSHSVPWLSSFGSLLIVNSILILITFTIITIMSIASIKTHHPV